MIIYSVTVSIDNEVREEWLSWMKTTHIPDVMATGYFSEYAIQQLLFPKPQAGTTTFNIQYLCESMEAYEAYQAKAAPALQKDHTQRYKERFVAFRSILKRI
jgi:hypothetical protein